MDFDIKKIGATLRYLREQKGISQENLCKENNPSEYICGLRYLRNIENGESEPSLTIFNKLLAELKTSHAEFSVLIDAQDMIDFQRDFSEIWELSFEKRNAESLNLLNELKTKSYCNPKNLTIKQALMLLDGLMLVRIDKNYDECLSIMHEALYITAPNAVKRGKINSAYVSKNAFTLCEYRILNIISLSLSYNNQTKDSIKLLEMLIKSLHNKRVDVEVRDRLLPNIYYNLSDTLIKVQDYKNSLIICEKGIEDCRKTKKLKTLPFLLYNRAKSLLFMDNKGDAETGFQQAYDTFLLHGDVESAEFTIKILAKNYQIYLKP